MLRFQFSTTPPLHHSACELVPEVGIAPTSQRLQRCANLPQLLGVPPSRSALRQDEDWLAEPKLNERRLVPSRGNAPRSLAYRASALLLSYKGKEMKRITVTQTSPSRGDPIIKCGVQRVVIFGPARRIFFTRNLFGGQRSLSGVVMLSIQFGRLLR